MNEEIDFLEEIFNHIKKIRNNEHNSENVPTHNSSPLIWEEVTEDDLFEVINKINEKQENITSKMDVNIDTRICDICKKTINLEENLSGLVIHDSHFLCEECCQRSSKEDLDSWTASKMAKPGDLKPVALWLMKEKNKNELF